MEFEDFDAETRTCFRCGARETEVRLFDAVMEYGLEKICGKCSAKENIPIIKKPTTFQLKESEKGYSVEERLTRISGISPKEEAKKKKETTLKELINKQVKISPAQERKPLDLIENFNWIVMRARKARHLTFWELSRRLEESEAVLKMVERGQLPEDDYRIIAKLEHFFKIRLRKSGSPIPTSLKTEKNPARILSFDKEAIEKLTIADLQKIKEMKEIRKEPEQKLPKKESREDLSEEEISNLIWGK